MQLGAKEGEIKE